MHKILQLYILIREKLDIHLSHILNSTIFNIAQAISNHTNTLSAFLSLITLGCAAAGIFTIIPIRGFVDDLFSMLSFISGTTFIFIILNFFVKRFFLIKIKNHLLYTIATLDRSDDFWRIIYAHALERSPHFIELSQCATLALLHDVRQNSRIAEKFFGSDTIDASVVQDAVKTNPYSEIILKDKNERIIGFCDLFVLREDMIALLKSGVFIEPLLQRDHFLPASQIKENQGIYLAAIVIDPANPFRDRAFAVKSLIYASLMVLDQIYFKKSDVQNIELIAIAWTAKGEALLRGLNFGELNTRKGTSHDGKIFSRWINRRRLKQRLGDDSIAIPPNLLEITFIEEKNNRAN